VGSSSLNQAKSLHGQGGHATAVPVHRFDNVQSALGGKVDTQDQENLAISGVSGLSLDRLAHNLGLSQARNDTRAPRQGANEGVLQTQSLLRGAQNRNAEYF